MSDAQEPPGPAAPPLPEDAPIPLDVLRHSTAHLLAAAVTQLWPKTLYTIGPPIEDGFYYDFDFGDTKLSEDDFAAIEAKMAELARARLPYERSEVSNQEARRIFGEVGQRYKVELLEGIPEEQVGLYRTGEFLDLCRGPHVPNSGKLRHFKLLSLAGAYWRGDEHREVLTRVYGTAWPSKDELEHYLHRREEARRRDHRRLGRELELFMNSAEVGPGLPILLPRGATIRHQLELYILDQERRHGFEHVYSSELGKLDLFKRSGHWEHYHDRFFSPLEMEGETYVLRPMNCPHHIQVYAHAARSYRDLPLRIAELGAVYRFEQSGEVAGLMRARRFTINDAHIFCTPEQLGGEFVDCLRMVEQTYQDLGLTSADYSFQLSLRDPSDREKYIYDDATWEQAEGTLRGALRTAEVGFREAMGEAAFYGPKIDVQLRNVLGHEETASTIQLDHFLPERFDLEYTNSLGQSARPVMIHRAPIGSFERMLAFLIEHFGGDFPLWYTPEQARVIPISDPSIEYAERVTKELATRGLRVSLDARNERMQLKVRRAEESHVPVMLVVGEREAAAESVDVRVRGEEQRVGALPWRQVAAVLERAATPPSVTPGQLVPLLRSAG